MHAMRFIIPYFVFVLTTGCSSPAQDFQAGRILAHIQTLADDSFQGRGTGTPGEKAASDYIISQFEALGLDPKGDEGTFKQRFPFKQGIHGQGEAGTSVNVVGFLDNGAATTIILGAHYDHLGMDGQNSSLAADPGNMIHNGADDNASGVAGVIELARYFSENNRKEKNNYLFVCFSGEELGLLGSKYFADNYEGISSANFMINMDMIGRLDPQTRTVTVHGTGTSPSFEPLLRKLETAHLKVKTDSSGTGPSDHTSFYLKNIPVLHFFTGAHSDYHKPTDDWDKINLEGQVHVLKLIAGVIDSLDSKPRLAFLETRNTSQAGRASFKVTLGIMPSYAGGENGLKVDAVTEGRPAHEAGIRPGDVIIRMGDHPVSDIQQYMEALGKFEKGQQVPVKIRRDGALMELSVIF